MANQWFKFYGGEYLSDPKIVQLNAHERSCWITLLCLASQSEKGEIKFLSEKQLLVMSGVTENASNDVLHKFEQLDMIRISNGIVTIINWEKRQYSEGYSRVKRFRERQSNTKANDRIEENRREENRIESIYTETFEKFWKEYPNKKAKKVALKCWMKIRPTEILFDRIMAALARQKKSEQWVKDKGKFIPHPATWLNQERWEDEGVAANLDAGGKSGKFTGLGTKV